mgnify:CR=1 FL=1
MATESTSQDFERVSRLKGKAFEALTFSASVTGILALAALLVYVSIDGFNLEAASVEWLLVYFGTLVVPYIGFCLYSANERAVTRLVLLLLGGGMVINAVGFTFLDTVVRDIPRLNWQLSYLFTVVLPVTGYVTVAGSQGRVGAVGFGLLTRLIGGTAFALWIFVLFVVIDPRLWYLVYTLGILPGGLLAAYGRWRSRGIVSTVAVVAAVVGIVAAFPARARIVVYPEDYFIYVWTIVVPLTVAVTVITARRWDRNTASLVGAAILLIAVGGSFLLGGSFTGGANLLVLFGVSLPTVTYVHRVLRKRDGAVGLLLPVLIVGGTLTGAYLVRRLEYAAPNSWLDISYVQGIPTTQVLRAREAGFFPPIVGSVIIISLVAVLSFVLGVGTAVFLEEYTSNSGVIGSLSRLLQVNIANLAAVPSVVYGLLGLGLFVQTMGLGLGTAISASLTLSLLILPITVISAQEAIRSVPNDLRDGSLAMGATRWQTTKNVILPEALPGILTGVILALGRAIGETAPLIMIGMADIQFSPPNDIWSRFSAMPMMIYQWANNPSPEFRFGVVAAGVLTLLLILLAMNASAIIIRNRYERGS